jgi:hypothetical protein
VLVISTEHFGEIRGDGALDLEWKGKLSRALHIFRIECNLCFYACHVLGNIASYHMTMALILGL